MKEIADLITSIGKLPGLIGKSKLGGILFTIIVCYALYLSAPLVQAWLNIRETVNIKLIEKSNESNTYKIQEKP
jgi:hypothetical protein